MTRPGDRDVAGLLESQLGVRGVVGSLRSLSERLWTPPVDERRETYSDLISDREAVAVVSVLSAHHERIDPWSVERLAALGPYVFGVGLSPGGLVPLDPVAGARVAACLPPDPITTVASIGHPNARRARAYADAIAATLPTLGL
jgi:hypothetical protein